MAEVMIIDVPRRERNVGIVWKNMRSRTEAKMIYEDDVSG